MFEALGLIMEGFIYVWIVIIGAMPGIFLGGLTFCLVATALTYFVRNSGNR